MLRHEPPAPKETRGSGSPSRFWPWATAPLTIVLGGLIRDEMVKTVQEVPLLSKLPLVGELFRFRNTNHRHSEIMVFITPHIIPDKP